MRLRLLSIALAVVGVLLLGGAVFLGTRPSASAPSNLYATAGPASVDGALSSVCTTTAASGAHSCEAYFDLTGSTTEYAMRGNDFSPPLDSGVVDSQPRVLLAYRTDGPVHITEPLTNQYSLNGDFFTVVQLSVLNSSGAPATTYTKSEYRTYLAGTREDALQRRGALWPLGGPGLALLLLGLGLLVYSLVKARSVPTAPEGTPVPVPALVGVGAAIGSEAALAEGGPMSSLPYQIREEGAVPAPPVTASDEGAASLPPAPAWPPITPGAPESPAPPSVPSGTGEPWYRQLGRPLPRVALMAAGAVVVLLLIALQVTGVDWAAGAVRLGIGAAVVAALVVLVTAVRAFVNRDQPSPRTGVAPLAAPAITIAVLLALTVSAFGFQSPIHSGQALFLDRGQYYQQAINEYKLAGDQPPGSSNCRGLQRLGREPQQGAKVLRRYRQVWHGAAGLRGRHQRGAPGATGHHRGISGMGQTSIGSAALRRRHAAHDALLALSYCGTDCQSQASALDATAYYNAAEADLAAGQFGSAVTAFTAIASRFPTSPEAGRIHGDFASALLGLGRGQVKLSCAAPLWQRMNRLPRISLTPLRRNRRWPRLPRHHKGPRESSLHRSPREPLPFWQD